ncbi:response regulator [Candidatus Kapabacteria bacterium]|nr:response regulator [Candidatus Kapabacteria bacterium]
MEKIKIIIVDNEAIQISNLQKLCERVYPNAPIHIATKFDKAYEIISNHNENAILFVSKDLPGLNGIKLFERLRTEKMVKDYCFVLTYHSITQDQKKTAVKAGVDRYLNKPFAVEDLLPILKNGIDLITSKIEKSLALDQFKELKDSFDAEVLKIKEIIDIILEERIPGIIEKSTNIENAAIWIAKKYGITDEIELSHLSIAAKLQFTGRLILNDKFLTEPVMKDGRLNDPIMKDIPTFAAKIISRIKGYETVKIIIENLYENFDGTGFPDGKKAAEIPKLSRILRVATDYYDIIETGEKTSDASDSIVNDARRLYDFIPAAYIDQYLAANNLGDGSKREIPISLKDISEGTILSRNIISKEGLVLLGANTNMNEDNLAKLRHSAETDGIIGDIYTFDIANTTERNAIDN